MLVSRWATFSPALLCSVRRNGRHRRAVAATAVAVAVVGVLAVGSAASAAPEPTLLGEALSAPVLTSVQVVPAGCDNAGTTTFMYTANGVATGPYPGPFTVTGTYAIGPSDPWSISTEVELDESFTISSGGTTITGTSVVATGDTSPYLSGASGQCMSFTNGFGQLGRLVFGSGLMRYNATLTDSTGTSHVTGFTGTTTRDERYDPCCPGEVPDASSYFEFFNTSTPVDTDPPLIALTSPSAVNATSAAGAIVNYTVIATDDVDPNPVVACTPISGSLFLIGDTFINCSARDASGKTATASFTMHVRGVAEQLHELGVAVAGLGPGTSLADKVTQIEASLAATGKKHGAADACTALGDFIGQVSAQTGKSIQPGTYSPSEAGSLIASAQRIQALVGC